jgi:hypothetical protein
MRSCFQVARHRNLWISAALIIFPLILLAFAATASQRINLVAKFVPGETMSYQIDTRTTTTGKIIAPIANPEGPSNLSQTISLLVRLDVLDVQQDTTASPSAVRFHATFEKSQARSESDAVDPDEPSLASQYSQLQGKSIDFTLGPTGQIVDVKGVEGIFPSRSASDPMLSWVQAISVADRLPRTGITIGQKWTSEHPIEGLPLSDVIWRTKSTYLRDEPCALPARPSPPPVGAAARTCAVILTSFEISRRGSARSDATPEEYLRNGLRTSGSWTGSGESLDSFSLATGLLQSSTRTSTQEVDYEIRSASTGSRIHRLGKMQTQSEIRLFSGPALGP